MIVDAATGRIERTMIRLENEDIVAALSTEYTLDDKLKLWVPAVFSEAYTGRVGGVREMIRCEARYTNYRRFEVTGRVKVVRPAYLRPLTRGSRRCHGAHGV